MVRKKAPYIAVFLGVGLLGATLDLLTKSLAFSHLREGQEITVIPGFFDIGCARNPGVVFSFGTEWPHVWLFLSVLAVPVILTLFMASKRSSWGFTICLGMILAGTLGNMVDRIAEGSVRDFIKVYLVNADGRESVWPLFNLADSFICVAVFLLVLESIFIDDREEPSRPIPPVSAAA